jgi:hypothetical protein
MYPRYILTSENISSSDLAMSASVYSEDTYTDTFKDIYGHI